MRDRTSLILTAHARRRARQRGLPDASLAALLELADREVPVGGGCVALSVSRMMIDAARAEGATPAALARLPGRVLLVGPNGVVMTALIQHRRSGRRYSRGGAGSRARLRRRQN
jgi:hypothetical protein